MSRAGSFFTLLISVTIHAHAAAWYVDQDNSSGTENGTSWATAFTTIQRGINAAFAGISSNTAELSVEVWVSEGVYDEARTSPNADFSNEDTGSIVMKEGVHLYGGFTGSETQRNERDWEAHETILDGSTSRRGEPAYHVVIGANNATLDGFTISGGDANGDRLPTNKGGGMYNYESSPALWALARPSA